jgi:arabinoxylan arabinofuranohydrolase
VRVEKLSYNADGSIPKITMTDAGAPQIESLNPYQQVEAETIAFSSGLTTAAKSDSTGIFVTTISIGDYIKVKGVESGTGASSVDLRVAAAAIGGKIKIRVGIQSGTVVATCAADATGGAQTWKTVNCPVTGGATGRQDLFFKFWGATTTLTGGSLSRPRRWRRE